jgi:hypothetical protein
MVSPLRAGPDSGSRLIAAGEHRRYFPAMPIAAQLRPRESCLRDDEILALADDLDLAELADRGADHTREWPRCEVPGERRRRREAEPPIRQQMRWGAWRTPHTEAAEKWVVRFPESASAAHCGTGRPLPSTLRRATAARRCLLPLKRGGFRNLSMVGDFWARAALRRAPR